MLFLLGALFMNTSCRRIINIEDHNASDRKTIDFSITVKAPREVYASTLIEMIGV